MDMRNREFCGEGFCIAFVTGTTGYELRSFNMDQVGSKFSGYFTATQDSPPDSLHNVISGFMNRLFPKLLNLVSYLSLYGEL
jgi:hypothetical protein